MRRLRSRLARRIDKRQLQRLREYLFKQTHRLRGLPSVRSDICAKTDDQRLLINCRLLDPSCKTQAIGLKYKDGSVQWIHDELLHYRTSPTSLSKAVLEPGQPDRFCGLVKTTQPCERITSLALKLDTDKIKKFDLNVQAHATSALSLVTRLLLLVPKDNEEKRRAFDHGIGPIIQQLWQTRAKAPDSGRMVTFNKPENAGQPEVSLIIPIYGRYDFIEYQLAQFINDEFMHEQEIIYVVDDPTISDEVIQSCRALARLYHLPFKVLLLKNNLGYAGANNVGVAQSSGKNILLLNSDVFVESGGWLKKLLDSVNHDLSGILLGARLKYHDESVQHDGMSFHASPFHGDLWINMHPGKGLPDDQFPRRHEPQERECVTGACLLLDRDDFLQLGGLDENFILGDFEDSDLCMKARSQNMRILLAEHVSLYHLERQSQALVTRQRWKQELTYYNCWQHSMKWDEQIMQLKQESVGGREH